MTVKVAIVDYGMGNLLSVARAFNQFTHDVFFAKTAEELQIADKIVLPGVGAFADGMAELISRNLVEPLKAVCAQGKPFLGICLGMQMMLDKSYEFGLHNGLGIIPGSVDAIPPHNAELKPHKIPHIGWNSLHADEKSHPWTHSILKGLPEKPYVYFVHSFMVHPECLEQRHAVTFYNELPICAVVQHENSFGCQFHPEKSGQIGLSIIENFVNL